MIRRHARDIVWRNKYLLTERKVKIYKCCVGNVRTYGIKTRIDIIKIKSLLRITKMKILPSQREDFPRSSLKHLRTRTVSGKSDGGERSKEKHLKKMNIDRACTILDNKPNSSHLEGCLRDEPRAPGMYLCTYKNSAILWSSQYR